MKNIYTSLAKFTQEVPVILKDTQGYGYSYSDLPAIFKVINPLMEKHGLGFYQAVNGTKIKTVVFHIDSAETIESETDIPQGVQLKGMNDFQVLGSAITYIKRYALSSLLGLVTDKDTDASGEQVKQVFTPKTVSKKDTVEMSSEEANSLATKALKEADSLDNLNIVREQITKSKILTDTQKTELGYLYKEMIDNFDPTK